MVFMGNTKKSVAYMLKHSHFFEPLPDKYIDSAFLDRIHAYNPGWEVSPIRHELFTNGYGFVVDYIAEVLKQLRTEDFTGAYKKHFEIVSEVSTRDQTGFEKTFSGLMKILYPDSHATREEVEEILTLSMECRRRVREHILRIDDTFNRHDFAYRPLTGGPTVTVVTPEEIQYPLFTEQPLHPVPDQSIPDGGTDEPAEPAEPAMAAMVPPREYAQPPPASDQPKSGHLMVPENTRGWSYRRLFARHLKGATRITISDPYIRHFYQVKNVMEFVQMVYDLVPEGDEVAIHLITQSEPETCVRQEEHLSQMAASFTGTRIAFTWEFDHNPNFHARSVTTDTGWKISIDRGLDCFQRYETGAFSAEQAIQEARLTRRAEVTYLQI